jgi:putative ABC transport system permease protein
LLAIGCVNVSSLLLARGLSRRRDYAIRIATGASHGRMLRQSFLEAMLLSFQGLAFALACSAAIIHFLRQSLDIRALGIADIGHAQIDFRMILFSFAISALAALVRAGHRRPPGIACAE